MKRPRLMITVGLPGAGKTTFAESYIETYSNTIHLSSDKIRKELWGDETTQGDNSQVFSLMQSRAIEALNNGNDVIYDATNMTRKDRAGIISVCPKFAIIEAIVIWAPVETCIERDATRERTVGKEVIDRMLKRFQAPYWDEGFEEIHIILPDNFDKSEYTRNIVKSLKIPHDNPHHTFGVNEHCMSAGHYVFDKDPTDYILWMAATYHDIGKPYTKAFVDSKGNPSEHAHYYQHQCVGSYISYGMTMPDEKQSTMIDVSWLISTHMDPFLNTKYYNKLPDYLKKKVDMLHEADRNAH